MASLWPGAPDNLISAAKAGPDDVKAAIDAIQVKIQRMLNAQPNAFPSAGGTVTPDMSQGAQLAIIMPAGNITIANPVNGQDGDFLTVYILQDALGARLVTWGANFRKGVIALSITANALDAVTFRYSAGAVKWNQIAAPVLAIV
jgi:hypothetical protein